MKITLHVGPHKTGTTSVQSWMLENSAHHLEEYGVYYPPTDQEGPGHALIAWNALGLNKREIDPKALKPVVDEALEQGAKHVVFSSEEFCRGLSRGTLKNLRTLNDYGELELIITLSPLPDRYISEISEEIKHVKTFDLENVDMPGYCLRRPGLWPGLVSELRDGIRPTETHVILVDKKYPANLIKSFARVLGIPCPETFVEHNRSFGDSHTRLLNFVNAEFTDLTRDQRWELSAKFAATLQADGLMKKMSPISFPESVTHLLTQIWDLQCELLQALDKNGELHLYHGKPSDAEERAESAAPADAIPDPVKLSST